MIENKKYIKNVLPYIKIPYAIIGFINEKDKKILIVHSSDILSSVSSNIKAMGKRSSPLFKDRKRVSIKILEGLESKQGINIRKSYWAYYYTKLGYALYRPIMPCNLKVVTGSIGTNLYVALTNKHKRRLIVGIFTNVQELEAFCEIYKQMDFITPIYSNNSLTREYMLELNNEEI